MPWEIVFDPHIETVIITATGEVSYDEAKTQVRDAIGLMERHHTNRVMADYSHGVSEVSLANLYWLVDFYKEVNAPTDMRAAVILPKSGHRVEAYQFHALAARNAGYNIRLFESQTDAEKWLQESGRPPGS